jgi:hypothetical protein
MSHTVFASMGLRLAVIAVMSLATVPLAGQAPAASTTTGRTSTPHHRTAWGDPDLQGIWTNTTTTPLERPKELEGKQVLTDEEWAQRDRQVAASVSFDNAPRAGSPGGYNEFWVERGKLSKRTSLIVDPPDGRLPPLTPQAQKRADARAQYLREHPADSWEDLSQFTRCLTRGLPGAMVPGFYNHNYQIFQAPGYVVILVEMIHEARIVPLDGRPHLGPTLRQLMGDSRGRWEGDTLVVETTNFSPNAQYRGISGANLRLVERFTRVDADTIDYQFTFDDPTTFTKPWTAAIPMTALSEAIYEYACHEGNYGIVNILRGHRAEERAAEDVAKKNR